MRRLGCGYHRARRTDTITNADINPSYGTIADGDAAAVSNTNTDPPYGAITDGDTAAVSDANPNSASGAIPDADGYARRRSRRR